MAEHNHNHNAGAQYTSGQLKMVGLQPKKNAHNANSGRNFHASGQSHPYCHLRLVPPLSLSVAPCGWGLVTTLPLSMREIYATATLRVPGAVFRLALSLLSRLNSSSENDGNLISGDGEALSPRLKQRVGGRGAVFLDIHAPSLGNDSAWQ